MKNYVQIGGQSTKNQDKQEMNAYEKLHVMVVNKAVDHFIGVQLHVLENTQAERTICCTHT